MQGTDSEDPLDEIVGQALVAMVENGVAAARVASFAESFRRKVAQALGRSPAKPAAPDLAQVVTVALQNAIASGHLQAGTAAQFVAGRSPPSAGSPASVGSSAETLTTSRPRFETVYVSVRGRRTSITLPPDLLEQARDLCPSRKQLRNTLQQLAEAAPSDGASRRRSQWVAARLLESLRSGSAHSTPQGSSMH